MKTRQSGIQGGFTLVELITCLMILGVISTFTIPKVLQGQQNSQFNAVAKEDAAAINAAYQAYKLNNQVTGSTSLSALSRYLNYISIDTDSLIDSYPGTDSLDCHDWTCYRMANGSVIAFDPGQTFGATDDLAITYFYVDPDSSYSDSLNGNGKSVVFFIYVNGRITTQEQAADDSHDAWGVVYHPSSQVGKDPTWFHW